MLVVPATVAATMMQTSMHDNDDDVVDSNDEELWMIR